MNLRRLILIFSLVTSWATAQEVFYLNLDTLSLEAATLEISDTYPTIVEFDGEITQAMPLREERVTYNFSGNIMWLSALATTGDAGVTLKINDRTAMFKIQINPDLQGPRRYVVSTPREVEPKAAALPVATAPPPAALSGVGTNAASSGVIGSRDLMETPYTFSSDLKDNVITYTLSYGGGFLLVNDLQQLRVSANGDYLKPETLLYQRNDPGGLPNRLSGGQSESGRIYLPPDVTTPVTLQWRVVEIGTGRSFLLEHAF